MAGDGYCLVFHSSKRIAVDRQDVIRQKGLAIPTPYPGPLRIRESLQKADILNARQIAIFEQLRALRNRAVHIPDAEFTKIAIKNYIESAITMASHLEGLVQKDE